jgi:hypothetical protein
MTFLLHAQIVSSENSCAAIGISRHFVTEQAQTRFAPKLLLFVYDIFF